MPMFDYACSACGGTFEAIVSSRDQRPIPCPECGATTTSKSVISRFAVGGRSGPDYAGPCGSCGDPRGPGSCALD